MKIKLRKGFRRKSVSLLVTILTMMSVLTACSEGSGLKSYYNLDVVDHTSDFYINDFAGVFSEEQKKELMDKAVAFDKEYSGIQVVITTVESLNETVLDYELIVEDAQGNRLENADKEENDPKFTIEQVAYSMYSEYGIGQDDMGILILFSTGDREVRIETGRQMQCYITDSMSGRILDDYGMNYFANDQFAEGLIAVQAGVIDKIKENVSNDWYTTSQKSDVETDSIVTDESKDTSNQIIATDEQDEEKDPTKGILWGFFGSIGAAFAAIIAFIRQKFKGNTERQNFEKAKQEEIGLLQSTFQSELNEKERIHETAMVNLKSEYQGVIREKDKSIQELRGEMSDLQHENSTLKAELEVLSDKYSRIQRLHPEYNFDNEVNRMIEFEYRASAKEVDSNLNEVLAIAANKDNYDVFNRALSFFDALQPEVKKYVTSDRAAIQKLYDDAIQLKEEYERAEQEKRDRAAAQTAYDKINQVCKDNPKGNYKTYKALDGALAIFLGLSVAEKAFFPDNNLIGNLKNLHMSAEKDYKDYEAATKAETNVRDIIGRMSCADEDDRDKLAKAMRYYRNLSSAQQAYFSDELLRKLKRLIEEADEDHRRQERRRSDEAAARRRAQQRSSYSSMRSSSRSSFSGRGGRPSGGGATRRF